MDRAEQGFVNANEQGYQSVFNAITDIKSTLNEIRVEICQKNRNIIELRREYRQSHFDIKAHLHMMQERLKRLEMGSQVPGQNCGRCSSSQTASKRTCMVKTITDKEDEVCINHNDRVHRECLQENLEAMVESFDLKNTELLDNLIEEECLTEEEASNIRELPCRRDQTRKLTHVVSMRSKDKFSKFLKKVEIEHKDVAVKLNDSYTAKLREGRSFTTCLVCVIKRDVDVRHVIDKLCSKFIVDLDFLHLVCSYSTNYIPLNDQGHLWEHVFAKINGSNDRNGNMKYLQEAMYTKYEHIAVKLSKWYESKLECRCKSEVPNINIHSLGEYRKSAAISEYSTTSTVSQTDSAVEDGAESSECRSPCISPCQNEERQSSNFLQIPKPFNSKRKMSIHVREKNFTTSDMCHSEFRRRSNSVPAVTRKQKKPKESESLQNIIGDFTGLFRKIVGRKSSNTT